MRYRVAGDGTLHAASSSADVVFATVCFTLLIGVIFLFAGIKAKQRWLQFWGGLTVICCAAYFLRDVFGLSALFRSVFL